MSAMASSLLPQTRELIDVLVVSPLDEDHRELREILTHSRWKVHHAFDREQARAILFRSQIPVVICARELPDGDWRRLLRDLAKLSFPPKVIVSSPTADDSLWVEALDRGAYDVLLTPFRPSEVIRILQLAWTSWKWIRPSRASKDPRTPAKAHPTRHSFGL